MFITLKLPLSWEPWADSTSVWQQCYTWNLAQLSFKYQHFSHHLQSLLSFLTVIPGFNRRCSIYSIRSSSCLLQERHWRSLARDHAVLSEWAHLWRKIGHTWKGVREWLCLLLLCLLHFPLLLSGQCSESYQPKQAHHYCSMSSHPTYPPKAVWLFIKKKKKKKGLKDSIVFRIGLGIVLIWFDSDLQALNFILILISICFNSIVIYLGIFGV